MKKRLLWALLGLVLALTACGTDQPAGESTGPGTIEDPAAALTGKSALYLRAMLDLTPEDGALDNGVTYLGVDLSQTTLTPEEQTATAEAFAEQRGLTLVQGTWEELVEQGYINGEELYWEDGVLYDVVEVERKTTEDRVVFSVGKWRSGLGAFRFVECVSERNSEGEWPSYEVGAMVIS